MALVQLSAYKLHSKERCNRRDVPNHCPIPEKGHKERVHCVLDIREHTLRLLKAPTGGGASVRVHERP